MGVGCPSHEPSHESLSLSPTTVCGYPVPPLVPEGIGIDSPVPRESRERHEPSSSSNNKNDDCSSIHQPQRDPGSEPVPRAPMPTPACDSKSNSNSSNSTTSGSAIQRTSRRHRSVRFSTAEFRYYPITIGDNPSVTSGVPLTIGWDHWKEATRVVPVAAIDDHDDMNDDFDNDYRCDGDTSTSFASDRAASSTSASNSDTDTDPVAVAAPIRRRRVAPGRRTRPRTYQRPEVRILEPAERACILITSGHSREELLDALSRTVRRRNELRRTNLEQQLLPKPLVAALEWVAELWESRPKHNPCGGGCRVRDCGKGTATGNDDGGGSDGVYCHDPGGNGTGRVPTLLLQFA